MAIIFSFGIPEEVCRVVMVFFRFLCIIKKLGPLELNLLSDKEEGDGNLSSAGATS